MEYSKATGKNDTRCDRGSINRIVYRLTFLTVNHTITVLSEGERSNWTGTSERWRADIAVMGIGVGITPK